MVLGEAPTPGQGVRGAFLEMVAQIWPRGCAGLAWPRGCVTHGGGCREMEVNRRVSGPGQC